VFPFFSCWQDDSELNMGSKPWCGPLSSCVTPWVMRHESMVMSPTGLGTENDRADQLTSKGLIFSMEISIPNLACAEPQTLCMEGQHITSRPPGPLQIQCYMWMGSGPCHTDTRQMLFMSGVNGRYVVLCGLTLSTWHSMLISWCLLSFKCFNLCMEANMNFT
jgi:hypothetical protein